MSAELEERSLSEKVIRDIFCGVFASGTWLKQIELEGRYKVSRTTVRRALDELTARRYVEHVPNRGYRVTQGSWDRRSELREIRRVLEVHAAKGILANAPEDAAAQLRVLAQKFEDSLENGSLQDQIAANGEFHEYLYGLSPNRTLFEELMEMRRRAVAMVTAPWSSLREMRSASRDHFAIVDALESRDLARFEAAIDGHIRPGPDDTPDRGAAPTAS
ncbi:GntR family transcriptional regulator [Pseudooceanicola nanhaiensis]|uniref:GntR family transcriptional regulator n=1 Tax=Pseudooceanicola nanhaiensis TaxID=375761 RepID=UPI001CD44BCC|nr:GntR family transcriptional regulator [Pseudooceanicola nanhaiensis]MCA0921414.1 GntR family transcriptional regulator [Pseudooceanicola nanhaiensis]